MTDKIAEIRYFSVQPKICERKVTDKITKIRYFSVSIESRCERVTEKNEKSTELYVMHHINAPYKCPI